jgi:hypothetical protein
MSVFDDAVDAVISSWQKANGDFLSSTEKTAITDFLRGGITVPPHLTLTNELALRPLTLPSHCVRRAPPSPHSG